MIVKRIFDLLVAGTALILLSPLLLAVMIAVRVKLGTPILFRQVRPGRNARPFELIKLRTMTDARGPDGAFLPDEVRLTRFGRVLRSTSLDELPSLINVIKGQMSLVGPRPLLMQYLDHYSPTEMRRHDVPPGLTGWAQVNGRNALSWDEKFALDIWYVDHRSLWLDIKILFLTVKQVLRRDGISHEGDATMPAFTRKKD